MLSITFSQIHLLGGKKDSEKENKQERELDGYIYRSEIRQTLAVASTPTDTRC